jgi:hypothetical protein
MSISRRFSDAELAVFLRGCRTSTEYWETHPDYPELTVSNLGGVRRDGKPLKPWPSGKGGYPAVMVRGRRRLVHHLVLEVYISHRPHGLETCHWDGKPWNVRLMNVRWDTHAANCEDRKRHSRERRQRALLEPQTTKLARLIAYSREHGRGLVSV